MLRRLKGRFLAGLVLAAGATAATAQSSAPDVRTAPAEPILDNLPPDGAPALGARAEQGDSIAGYLLFVQQDRSQRESADSVRWLARFSSANTSAARYAFALSHYRAELKGQVKGVEVLDTAGPLNEKERQRQIATLQTIAPEFPKAYALLAAIYRDGLWVPADANRAAGYLDKGVKAGVAAALLTLGQSKLASGDAAEAARLGDAAAAAGEPAGGLLACAAYSQVGNSSTALTRCKAAADMGAAWAQLATAEILGRSTAPRVDEVRRYLLLAAQAADLAIADRAAIALATLDVTAGAPAHAIELLGKPAERSAPAAWFLGRLYLDQKQDSVSAARWLTRAQAMPGADLAAIGFDLARATKAAGGDWLPVLRKSADEGHARAALVLAFELQNTPPESRRYAQLAAKDPVLRERAQQLLDYLAKAGS